MADLQAEHGLSLSQSSPTTCGGAPHAPTTMPLCTLAGSWRTADRRLFAAPPSLHPRWWTGVPNPTPTGRAEAASIHGRGAEPESAARPAADFANPPCRGCDACRIAKPPHVAIAPGHTHACLFPLRGTTTETGDAMSYGSTSAATLTGRWSRLAGRIGWKRAPSSHWAPRIVDRAEARGRAARSPCASGPEARHAGRAPSGDPTNPPPTASGTMRRELQLLPRRGRADHQLAVLNDHGVAVREDLVDSRPELIRDDARATRAGPEKLSTFSAHRCWERGGRSAREGVDLIAALIAEKHGYSVTAAIPTSSPTWTKAWVMIQFSGPQGTLGWPKSSAPTISGGLPGRGYVGWFRRSRTTPFLFPDTFHPDRSGPPAGSNPASGTRST